MANEIKPDKRSITVNPEATTIYIKSDWSIPPPREGEYGHWHSQNKVEPLICEAYLNTLYKALDNAKKSIYITVWGFDPSLRLSLDQDKSTGSKYLLGEVLKRKAEEGCIVKVLVWYHSVVSAGPGNFPNYRFSRKKYLPHQYIEPNGVDAAKYSKHWLAAANAGSIENLELSTRSTVELPKYYKDVGNEIEVLEKEQLGARIRKAQYPERKNIRNAGVLFWKINPDYTHPYEDDPSLAQKDEETLKTTTAKLKELRQSYLEGLEKEYTAKGLSYPHHFGLENISSHHQKAIIIDQEKPEKAVGFVQGFNLLPGYFDKAEHPYNDTDRLPGTDHSRPLQDVGVRIEGGCLPDIYRNFQQSWSLHAKSKTAIGQAPLDGALYSKHLSGFKSSAQILRTYPYNREREIEKWIYLAISRMNRFIYIEDQYFRHAGFAKAIIDAAKLKKEPLYVFVVTLPPETKAGTARAETLQQLNRSDLIMSESKAEKKGDEALKKAMLKMKAAKVFVHVCLIRTSKDVTAQSHGRYTIPAHTRYKDIYVHSKLTIIDNKHYLVGSANYNIRSMHSDTELAIAVEDTRKGAVNEAYKLRIKLWDQHVNSIKGKPQWNTTDPDGNDTKPEQWYDDWQKTMTKNDERYQKKKPRISNIFTLYGDPFQFNMD